MPQSKDALRAQRDTALHSMEKQAAHAELRTLRRAINELSLHNIRRGIDNEPVIVAREFVNNAMEHLVNDPDAYLSDMRGNLSPLALLLGTILYRDMVQS